MCLVFDFRVQKEKFETVIKSVIFAFKLLHQTDVENQKIYLYAEIVATRVINLYSWFCWQTVKISYIYFLHYKPFLMALGPLREWLYKELVRQSGS